jgi:hypothetical protein
MERNEREERERERERQRARAQGHSQPTRTARHGTRVSGSWSAGACLRWHECVWEGGHGREGLRRRRKPGEDRGWDRC